MSYVKSSLVNMLSKKICQLENEPQTDYAKPGSVFILIIFVSLYYRLRLKKCFGMIRIRIIVLFFFYVCKSRFRNCSSILSLAWRAGRFFVRVFRKLLSFSILSHTDLIDVVVANFQENWENFPNIKG